MFTLALLIGIYAYSIFLFGLVGILYWPVIVLFSFLYILGSLYYFRKKFVIPKFSTIKKFVFQEKLFTPFLLLIFLQAIINFIGVFGPELGFDALWYHLTLPKFYLANHAILHIPGGLFYYSDMPKLIELLYTGLLGFHIDFLPKLLHFGFGIATVIILYRFSRKFLSPVLSILVCALFYSNLVVGWESISAYIDLGRTFFELLGVVAFFNWIEKKLSKWFYIAAIMVGLAIATKTIAFSSLFICIFLIIVIGYKQKKRVEQILKWSLSFILIVILIPMPWFVFAVIHTGNPLYPLFDPIYGNGGSVGWQFLNPFYFVTTFWTLFTHAADPISPWYLMLLPLVLVFYKKMNEQFKYLYFYSVLALLFWYLTPNTGGGRFILPYLPLFSLVTVYPLQFFKRKQQMYFIILAATLVGISIIYRGAANAKFLPVLVRKEPAAQFLTKNLNFSYGDFYDTDEYFARHIKPTDTVLLYGFHNLYYVDFPFIDSSYITKGDTFNYIAVKNGSLPERFRNWSLIYTNPVTHVSLYTAGRIPWTY